MSTLAVMSEPKRILEVICPDVAYHIARLVGNIHCSLDIVNLHALVDILHGSSSTLHDAQGFGVDVGALYTVDLLLESDDLTL